ncbi:MAG: DsbA family protein [Beijerinckiaceae bacterium]|nr:DsbA family protein [Beijerinckiaceae bacterium]
MHSSKTRQAALMSRRDFIEAAAAIALTIAGFAGVFAAPSTPVFAQGGDVAAAELMAGEALPDIALGASDAPVTIVEYASMTCTHCAGFHATTFPELKRKYIDTGKVRFILREFPLDPLGAAGFMLARCAGDDKRNAIVDLLFAQQKNWAFTGKPVDALAGLLKQTGMSQASFDACLNNQPLYNKIAQVHDRAAEKFGVSATPTFFINGKRQKGEITPEALENLLAPLLKG